MNQLKLKEFAGIKDLNKFHEVSHILFSDKKPCYTFWKHNKKSILSSNDEYCKIIKKQFWIHKNSHLIEFANCQNLDKFNDNKNYLFFEDGTKMSVWFRRPGIKEEIFSYKPVISDDLKYYKEYYYNKIKNDYYKYKNQKLIEFIEIDDLNKFYSNGNIKFKDGSSTYRFWIIYKSDIINSNDTLCLRIKEQYNDYKDKKFINRLIEFLKMDDSIKFTQPSKKQLSFSDGKGVSSWYLNNKNKIKETVCEMIKIYEEGNIKVPKFLLNKVYLDTELKKKYK